MEFDREAQTAGTGKLTYRISCVFSILMSFVSFALRAARSLMPLVSLLGALSFKRTRCSKRKAYEDCPSTRI